MEAVESLAMEEGAQVLPTLQPPSIGELLFSDYSVLVVLLATLFGFLLPMLWVYPPVAPRLTDLLNETHTALGLQGEADSTADGPGSEPASGSGPREAPGPARIAALWIYPIAACRGIRLARSRLLPAGLELDGLFSFAQLPAPFPASAGAVVDGAPPQPTPADDVWEPITTRQFPRLATLHVTLWRPDQRKAARAQAGMRADDRAERMPTMGETFAVVRFPWRPAGLAGAWAWVAAKLTRGWRGEPEVEVVLPVAAAETPDKRETADKAQARARAEPSACIRIGGRVVRVPDLSGELPRSLQLYLGVSNRLGIFRTDVARRTGAGASAADGEPESEPPCYPVRLLGQASIHAYESASAADDRQPRANIIVSGVPAHDEDSWRTVSFASPASSPPQELATFQRQQTAGNGQSADSLGIRLAPTFGSEVRPELMEHIVEVGMTVNVLQRATRKLLAQ